ncbi:MAG: hypothetical protein MCSN_4540 [Candidatus Microsyncoccus archaeolyticus]|nr:MAG: hypothetical protein MCSN_4540 [Candidatus Parcubacteria bacterium]
MNSDLILQITFLLSFAGVVGFALRKSPQVAQLPEKECFYSRIVNNSKENFLEVKNNLKKKTENWENSLHKFLFKTRILFLKADNKTLDLIKKLKQRSEKRKGDDGYWKDIKKSIKKKNKPA